MRKHSKVRSLLRCPLLPRWKGDLVGCGSTNLSEEDDEGLFDCLDCGLFFTREAATVGPASFSLSGQSKTTSIR